MTNRLMAYVAARLRGDDPATVRLTPTRTNPRKVPYTVIEVDLINETASVVGHIEDKHDDYRNEWPAGPRGFRLVYFHGKFISGRASKLEPNEAWDRAKQIALAAAIA